MPILKSPFLYPIKNRTLLSAVPCAVLVYLVFAQPKHLLDGKRSRDTSSSDSEGSVPASADDMDIHDKKYAYEYIGPGRPR